MKIKFFVLISMLIPLTNLFPQNGNTFKFNKNFYDCEDRWVTTPSKDSSFSVGFIYLDLNAGFTLDYLGKFIKTYENKYMLDTSEVQKEMSKYSMKIRLQDAGNTAFMSGKDENGEKININPQQFGKSKYAVLSEEIIKELGLPNEPKWLKYYKDSNNTVETMTKRGYHLNHVGRSDLAIPVLENAFQLAPDSSDIQFELSFAYNATRQFDKAVPILEKAISKDSNNVLFYKELAYSYTMTKRYSETEMICLKIIEKSDIDEIKAEAIINLVGIYLYFDRDKAKFWFNKLKLYVKGDSPYKDVIDRIEEELNK